jgi:hypothetical protein
LITGLVDRRAAASGSCDGPRREAVRDHLSPSWRVLNRMLQLFSQSHAPDLDDALELIDTRWSRWWQSADSKWPT